MRHPRPRAPAWRRALAFTWRIVLTVLRVSLILLLVVIPVPFFFKPNIGPPQRRNQPAQVKPRE